MVDDESRAARQKALAEKKKRLEEIKARRRQPTSTGGGSSGASTSTTGGNNLDSYIDDLLNTTAPGLALPTTTAEATKTGDTVVNIGGEESKVDNIAEEVNEATPNNNNVATPQTNATDSAPSQPIPQVVPKVETFEIAIQCMEDDFPPPSLIDEDEVHNNEEKSQGSSDGENEDDMDAEKQQQQESTTRGHHSSSSILRSSASYEQTITASQPLSEEEKRKMLSSQPFTQFLSTASKRVERLLGASDTNMYGILNGSGWGVTGSFGGRGSGEGVGESSGGGTADFSVDYANDDNDDEYYDTDNEEITDGVGGGSSTSTTTTMSRRKKRRSKKTKEEAYQTGGYFTARATYEFPKFTHGRNVTDIEWCPGHKEWVLASYNAVSSSARDNAGDGGGDGSSSANSKSGGGMTAASSNNPTTRHLSPLDPSSSFLQTSNTSFIPNEGIVAIYNLSMPSRPEHLFCAGCPILHSQFHPTEHPRLILGGGASGQVLVWDARVGRYPVQRSASASLGGGHDCELVGMKVLGNDTGGGGGGGAAGGLSTSKLVTASSDGKVNYWSVSNLREPIEQVQVNANLSCLEVLHGGTTNEGVICGDERGGLHSIVAGTGRDGTSASNKRVIRTLHPGGVIIAAATDDDMNDGGDADGRALAELGHYGMVTSVATRPTMPTMNSPRLSNNKETTSNLGGTSKGFLRGAGGLMVTTGVDWSTKLWAPAYTERPLMSFLSNSYDYMCDAQW